LQIKFLSDERAVIAEECTKAATKAERLEKELSQAVSDRSALRAALTDTQTHIHGLSASLQTVTAEKVTCIADPLHARHFDAMLSVHAGVPLDDQANV
jgi:phage shock protein A